MCTNCVVQTPLIPSSAEAFSTKLIDTMNMGALTLMISVGHRTGLFDVMAELPPASSNAIAKSADLNERYVREWLGAMVTGQVVTYDKEAGTYYLPREHAAFLTRKAGSDNIATLTQYIAELGSVESKIVECFKRGGGVSYEEFSRFHEVMADDSGQSVLPALFDHILPLIPGIKEKLAQGIEVCDLGCGRGKALLLLAKTFPKSHFTGYDFSKETIAWASAEAKRLRLNNIKFLQHDAANLEDTGRFDLIFTFDAIHDQADPQRVLQNIYRALKPDGVYLMQDIDTHSEVGDNLNHPIGTLLYTISTMHCMTVSLAQGGAGLGAAWGVELAEKMLRHAGFTRIEVKRLAHDIQNAYFIIRK